MPHADAASSAPKSSPPPQPILATLPLPLFPVQVVLRRIVRRVAHDRPELFHRLGAHRHKRFLIDPINMPFVLLLEPDAERPRLEAYRRWETVRYEARIRGTFLTLLDMIDGRLDGDALFFSRNLIVEGDTEAVVSLRNALDDLEGSVVDDAAALFGPLGRAVLLALRLIRAQHGGGGATDVSRSLRDTWEAPKQRRHSPLRARAFASAGSGADTLRECGQRLK
jgi:predicted lipid carrier protein YhbT